jgi:hypothetical protein
MEEKCSSETLVYTTRIHASQKPSSRENLKSYMRNCWLPARSPTSALRVLGKAVNLTAQLWWTHQCEWQLTFPDFYRSKSLRSYWNGRGRGQKGAMCYIYCALLKTWYRSNSCWEKNWSLKVIYIISIPCETKNAFLYIIMGIEIMARTGHEACHEKASHKRHLKVCHSRK